MKHRPKFAMALLAATGAVGASDCGGPNCGVVQQPVELFERAARTDSGCCSLESPLGVLSQGAVVEIVDYIDPKDFYYFRVRAPDGRTGWFEYTGPNFDYYRGECVPAD